MSEIIQGSEEWKILRCGYVTASRVKDVLASGKAGAPSLTRRSYLIDTAIGRVTKSPPDSFSNDAMAWGVEQEPKARAAYEAFTGNLVSEIDFVKHPSIEFFGASPDGIVDGGGLIECKCPNSSTHWKTISEDKAPNQYIGQMMAQMACIEREWVDFVSYDPRMPASSRLFIKRVFRDEAFIKEMEKEVKKFLVEVAIEAELMLNRNLI